MGLEGPGPYLTTDAQALRVKHSVLNQLPISSDLKHEIWLGARWVSDILFSQMKVLYTDSYRGGLKSGP